MTLTAQVKSHFLNLYNMVLADGTVKPEELMQIYQIGKRHGVSEDTTWLKSSSPTRRLTLTK